MAYAGPAPPKGSGPHRYVLMVFAQKDAIESAQLPRDAAMRREKFDVAKFLSQTEQWIDDVPIAGNVFSAENK